MIYKTTESFKARHNLKYFYGAGAVKEGGYYPLKKENNYYPHLKLSGMAINPNGLNNCRLIFEYMRFDDDAEVTLALGKNNLNDLTDAANIYINFDVRKIVLSSADMKKISYGGIEKQGRIVIDVSDEKIKISIGSIYLESEIKKDLLCGYMEISACGGEFWLSGFEAESDVKPFSKEENEKSLEVWRHNQLDLKDRRISELENYIKSNPDLVYRQKSFINVPKRLIDRGEKMTVELVSENGSNYAFAVTHNCMKADSIPECIPVSLKETADGVFKGEVDIEFNTAGNTRLEFWSDGEKTVRQIAVWDKGYMAVIPWIGDNRPPVDEEIHRYDIPGDCLFPQPKLKCFDDDLKAVYRYTKNIHKYGDRGVNFICAADILPESETTNIFDLDLTTQKRGFEQIIRLCKIMNMGMPELFGSYTIDEKGIDILENLGIKGLTSLCVWQNWQDGTSRINHWGAPNQPYYPSKDDFRRAGEKRDIMCFSMGNSSSVRNRTIMSMEGCPTLVVPGERYMENRVVHFQLQRFYDAFDMFISNANESTELLVFTLSLEAFCGHSDHTATNDLAMRYVYRRCEEENIIFTSAADVSDYHRRKGLKMQKAHFFQPDFYYGYRNGMLNGRTADRIEADTPDYLAVVRKGNNLPEFFFDYTGKWDSEVFEGEMPRNEFGLVNPEETDVTLYSPKQVDLKNVNLEILYENGNYIFKIKTDREIPRLVTSVFDIPFENDFSYRCEKPDVEIKKITDCFTGNTHIFVDLGKIENGKTDISVHLDGKYRKVKDAEIICGELGTMWFKDHAYLRSMSENKAIQVSLKAPETAYIIRQDGVAVRTEGGMLKFTVNSDWSDESPILYGFERNDFENALTSAEIMLCGESKTKKWSW